MGSGRRPCKEKFGPAGMGASGDRVIGPSGHLETVRGRQLF